MKTGSRHFLNYSSLGLAIFGVCTLILPPRESFAKTLANTVQMNTDRLKQQAFELCQKPFKVPVIVPIPMLDPPQNGGPESIGMVYQEELEVKSRNLLDANQFYFSSRPRLTVNTLPMDIYVDTDNSGNYNLKTWADANPDYSSPLIRPAINKNKIPKAGRVLTELIIGHRSPNGDYPQLFDIRSSAYVRFAGFPPQITGASLRLGAHKIFSKGAKGQTQPTPEDFPIVRSMFIAAPDETKAVAYLLVDSNLFCGALKLDMSPTQENAIIVVDSHWYTREDFHWKTDPHSGLVAYSSMFWKKQQMQDGVMRSAAHDSDMMTVDYVDGRQFRVAINPPQAGLKIQELSKGKGQAISWTLANEDRDPSHYADFKPALGNTNYDLRASYKVEILKSNIKTGVSLYQQAADGEYGDNIVAVSTIRQDVLKAKNAGQSIHFKYKTTAFFPPYKVAAKIKGPDQCEFIRKKLLELPSMGGTINIPAGTFNCNKMIVVKKSNVRIRGAGMKLTTLRLADQSPAPVLVIGDETVIQDTNGNWITATRVKNVEVSDLTVDGNLINQDPKNECGEGICDGDVANIRNNAITIRGASYVTLNRITTHSAISGGLVTEKYCDHLHVKDFTSYGNFFDGFAGYQTTESLFENVNLSRNKGAGISIDIQFDNNTFSGGLLASNSDVGIFARNLSGNVFENLTISNSGNHGAFFAEAEVPGTCANNNEFRAVTFENSKGHGIHIASPCTGNKVTGASIFRQNSAGCYFINPATKMSVSDETICQ